jgi:uncharacterized membrane protein
MVKLVGAEAKGRIIHAVAEKVVVEQAYLEDRITEVEEIVVAEVKGLDQFYVVAVVVVELKVVVALVVVQLHLGVAVGLIVSLHNLQDHFLNKFYE